MKLSEKAQKRYAKYIRTPKRELVQHATLQGIRPKAGCKTLKECPKEWLAEKLVASASARSWRSAAVGRPQRSGAGVLPLASRREGRAVLQSPAWQEATANEVELGEYYGHTVNDGSRMHVGEIAGNLSHWWSGQGDPIYKIAYQFKTDQAPDVEDVEWARRNLSQDLRKHPEGTPEHEELTDLISALDDYVERHGPADEEDSSVDKGTRPSKGLANTAVRYSGTATVRVQYKFPTKTHPHGSYRVVVQNAQGKKYTLPAMGALDPRSVHYHQRDPEAFDNIANAALGFAEDDKFETGAEPDRKMSSRSHIMRQRPPKGGRGEDSSVEIWEKGDPLLWEKGDPLSIQLQPIVMGTLSFIGGRRLNAKHGQVTPLKLYPSTIGAAAMMGVVAVAVAASTRQQRWRRTARVALAGAVSMGGATIAEHVLKKPGS